VSDRDYLTCVLAKVAIGACHLLAEQRIKLNRIGGGFGLNKGGAQTPRINDEWLRIAGRHFRHPFHLQLFAAGGRLL